MSSITLIIFNITVTLIFPLVAPGQVVVEARVRLVAGLKRYFHAKRGEGLLSAEGMQLLDHACDLAMDRADHPLNIWSTVRRYSTRLACTEEQSDTQHIFLDQCALQWVVPACCRCMLGVLQHTLKEGGSPFTSLYDALAYGQPSRSMCFSERRALYCLGCACRHSLGLVEHIDFSSADGLFGATVHPAASGAKVKPVLAGPPQ